MASHTPLNGTFADIASDRVLRALIDGIMALPYERRVPAMGRIMRQGIGPLAGYTKRARKHLAMIFPDLSGSEQQKIASQVCDNFGRTMIENYSWPELHDRVKNIAPTGAGMDAIDDARSNGRPILFVTGHFGNHEVPRHVLTELGYNIGGLYRPMGNPYFNAHYEKTMTSWGGPVFAQGRRGTAGFAKHLKSGGMGTLLFDVAFAGGVAVNFLGKPAMTATSAADLSLRFNALVVPYFAKRQPDGLTFDVTVEAPIPAQEPLAMMQDMTDRLAAQVRQAPEQWFWVHRRWKMRQQNT